MKQRPAFDRFRFARDIAAAIGARSLRQCVDAYPFLTINALSRATSQKRLSAENLLALCNAFELDPWVYFSVENQAVPHVVSRETRGGIGGILDGLKRPDGAGPMSPDARQWTDDLRGFE